MQKLVSSDIASIETELCYNIAVTAPLTAAEKDVLMWYGTRAGGASFAGCAHRLTCIFLLLLPHRLLRETYEPQKTTEASSFGAASLAAVVEARPAATRARPTRQQLRAADACVCVPFIRRRLVRA